MITRTHNGYHLGDNLVHLNFLRKVALANPDRSFVHAAQWQYLPELQPVVADVPNIKLSDINYMTPPSSIDSWRGTQGFWYHHEDRNDFVKFHVESWFPYLARRMGVENPVMKPEDMLFDYPALKNAKLPPEFGKPFDVLVVNSAPGSGQFQGFDQYELGLLAVKIARKTLKVVATAEMPNLGTWMLSNTSEWTESPLISSRFNLNCTQIGALSLLCHTILMVSTGPSWPTFNIWNQDSVKLRVILLDSERVNLAPHTVHYSKVEEAAEILKGAGLL
jgi:hypothetical protein